MTQNETKLASYHNTPFTKVCLGMAANNVTNWIQVSHNATSLYSVIADGSYRETNVGRAEWMSLINDAKLDSTCQKEGFNVQCNKLRKARIGILGGVRNCNYCVTVIGFGIKMNWEVSSGNILDKKNVLKVKKLTFGYIFVQ